MKRTVAVSFSDLVRAVVRKKPKEGVLTYGQVAERAGNAKAARAVARVMSQNYDLTVPCHRVIRADGKVGEYNRGGEAAKRALLIAEGWNEQTKRR